MSFDDLNVFDKDGNPRGVILPTQAIVIAEPGVRLTEIQDAEIRHAYKLFTDVCHASGSSYQVVNRELSDGTRLRMERNTGNDRLWVWPKGGEETEIIFLASPRGVYPDSPYFDGVPTKEPSVFSIKKDKGGLSVKLVKHEVFKEKPDGTTALEQQPGNCVWLDMRAEGRISKSVLSWWCDQRGIITSEDYDWARFGSEWAYRKRFWNPSTKNRLYLDGEKLVDLDNAIAAACLFKDNDGVMYVRAICFDIVNWANRYDLYFMQSPLSGASNFSNWTNLGYTSPGYSPKPLMFNMQGDTVALLYLASGSMRAAELDFATRAITDRYAGATTRSGTPVAGYGTPTSSGYVNGTLFTSAYTDTSWTATYPYSRTGEIITEQAWPCACGYNQKSEFVYYKFDVSITSEITEDWTQADVGTGYVEYTFLYTEYVPDTPNPDREIDHYNRHRYDKKATTSTDHISYFQTARTVLTKVVGASSFELFDTGIQTVYDAKFSGTGTVSYAPSSDSEVVLEKPHDDPWVGDYVGHITGLGIGYGTNVVDSTPKWTYNTDYVVMDWWSIVACETRADYLVVGRVRYEPKVVLDGRIAAQISAIEYIDAQEVARTDKTESMPSASWPEVQASISLATSVVFVPEVVPAYKEKSYSNPFFMAYAATDTLTAPSTFSTVYSGSDWNLSPAYTASCFPVLLKPTLLYVVLSGIFGNNTTAWEQSADPSGYLLRTWSCGDVAGRPYDDFKLDKDYGFSLSKVITAGDSVDCTNAIKNSLAKSIGDGGEAPEGRYWLSSPLYIPTWKIKK